MDVNKYKFAALDMDGTLLDTMKFWRSAISISCKKCGYGEIGDTLYHKLDTMSCEDGIEYIKKEYKGTSLEQLSYDNIISTMEELYAAGAEARDGVPQMLHNLKSSGVRMCVISATPTKQIQVALKKAGIENYFDFILSPDDFPECKSEPRIFEAAAEKFGCKTSDMALFEDSYYAMETGKKVGMYIVAVAEKYAAHNIDKEKEICDEFYNEFTEFKYV